MPVATTVTTESTESRRAASPAGRTRSKVSPSDEGSRKRRFVWPDELHASFVSAVFDVGLRCATSPAIARLLPAARSDVGAIEHLLSRYREARNIDEGTCAANQPVAVKSSPRDGVAGLVSAAEAVSKAEPSFLARRSLDIAQRQLDLAADSEKFVRQFRPRLRARRRELSDALRDDEPPKWRKVSSRDASPPVSVVATNDYHAAQHLEMECHMDFHRRVLLSKAEAQLETDLGPAYVNGHVPTFYSAACDSAPSRDASPLPAPPNDQPLRDEARLPDVPPIPPPEAFLTGTFDDPNNNNAPLSSAVVDSLFDFLAHDS